MPHGKSSKDGGSALRRSPRFLRVNSTTTQKSKSKRKQESHSRISSSVDAYLRPPLRSIENVSSKKRSDGSLERFSKNVVGSVGRSGSSGKSSNGSGESDRKVKGVEGFQGLRRSPRFSNKENASEFICGKTEGSKPDEGNWESAGFECRILTDIEVFSLDLERFSKNLVRSVGGSESSGKSSNGSRESERKVKGIEGFQGLRRSPRFSNKENASEFICGETKGSKPDEGNLESDRFECRILTDKDAFLEGKQRDDFGKRVRTRAAGTTSSLKIVGKDEVTISSLVEEFCGTRVGGRAGCSVICPVKKMERSGENKRRNVCEGVEEDTYKKKMQQCKKNVGAQYVKNLMGGSGTKKSMECISGSGKSTEKTKEIEGIPGPRRSPRFSNMSSALINEKSSKSKDKPNLVKGENNAEVSNHASGGLSDKGVFLEAVHEGNLSKHQRIGTKKDEEKAGLGFNSSKEGRNPSSEIVPEMTRNGGREKSGGNINAGIGGTTSEQTSNQFEENVGTEGWTEEQEAALQRAYFAAKPSPHFWKKVSKLVPGKSAQECFDRVHSSFPTPPQRPPRSRAKKTNSSPSLSGSKLLEPTDLGAKRLKRNKEKKCLVQKTARHLLQKHSIRDQGYEADLFSIFESTTNSSAQALLQTKTLSTPDCAYKKHGFFQECQERPSSINKRRLPSRFNNSSGTPLASPPVLKQVKNMKLHEKYIDQLHRRDAARRIEGRKYSTTHKDRKLNPVQKVGIVKAAKETLVSDARDMIYKFQDLQANAMAYYEDSDEDCGSDCRDD